MSDSQAKIRDAELADRYAQALNDLDQEQWAQAADLLAAIEQEQPGYRDADALLKDSPTETTRDRRSHATSYPTTATHPDDDPSAPEHHHTTGSSDHPETLANRRRPMVVLPSLAA